MKRNINEIIQSHCKKPPKKTRKKFYVYQLSNNILLMGKTLMQKKFVSQHFSQNHIYSFKHLKIENTIELEIQKLRTEKDKNWKK